MHCYGRKRNMVRFRSSLARVLTLQHAARFTPTTGLSHSDGSAVTIDSLLR